MKTRKLPSSFRDPSGFLFTKDNTLYRQINTSYKESFDQLIKSGLYEKLVKENLLIAHKRSSSKFSLSKDAYKIIKPEYIPFVSYPYEWCFSQLKDAALLTLQIQKHALKYEMTLKDASAYNVLFVGASPIFIDTLSFESYEKGMPWIAYKQFCQHFLSPLLLMALKDVRLNKLSINFIDGVPLDLTSKLLAKSSFLNPNIFAHIHLHAKTQKMFQKTSFKKTQKTLSKKSQVALIENLISFIEKLRPKKQKTQWQKYYTFTNYSRTAFKNKKNLVSNFLKLAKNKNIIWDLGANTGEFSQIASKYCKLVISIDSDPQAVELNYTKAKRQNNKNILPIISDITNPSPSIGWVNKERVSLFKRGSVDLILALALIHHLAISNNLSFQHLSDFFADISEFLIVEFIPKEDSNAKILLASRKDIFPDYNEKGFETKFNSNFQILEKQKINDSKRTLYLMKRK